MATYKDAGVDIDLGDECSAIAYKAAKGTFSGRKGMIGEPVLMEGGFTGAMDFGDYYLVQNDDGIGTKMIIAKQVGRYSTMGYDLLAMVVDDAICAGAEVVSISNTIDIDKVDKPAIREMMEGLMKACIEQKVVIPGGEIAELGSMVKGIIWNATAVGIVEKKKMITGEKIKAGDPIIGFREKGFRSNGFTLIRYILDNNLGKDWHKTNFGNGKTWGEMVLTPTKIYHAAVLEMIGRYKQKPQVEIKGIAHITGGGLPGNVVRILENNNLGAKIDILPEVPDVIRKVKEIGKISDEEAFKSWNMGIGMVVVSDEFEKIKEIAQKHDIEAVIIGIVTGEPGIEINGIKF